MVAVFVLSPSSRSYLGGCNPGDDAHVDMGGGVSQPGLAQGLIEAKLGFKLASSALENGFVGPRFDPYQPSHAGEPLCGRPAHQSRAKHGRTTSLATAALLLSGLSLGGCATSTAGSSLMDARAEAPAIPKASVYLSLEDRAPKRAVPAMTADERSKIAKELIAARDRQAPAGKARGGAARAEPMKP
jgi:hypothetical protein